ncbi:MAG: hypothetical protein ACRD2B_15140 [Terriglobia bacterium]
MGQLGMAGIPASARNTKKSKWLGTIPLVVAEDHDIIPLFARRRGGEDTDLEAEYNYTRTEEFAAHLEKSGITLLISYFYKAYGIEAEKEYIDAIRDFAPVLKKHNVKVGLYIGSTIAYETFLKEKPEASEWFVPDYLGRPVIYDKQTFRKRVYFMDPGYLDYMKRVMRIGVEEVKADEMDFDNTSYQATPEIFEHPLAIQHFREYLQKKYTPAQLKKRFGFSDVRYVIPPEPDWPLSEINDPLFQEWTDFRCQQLDSYYAQMKEVIEGGNPGVVIAANPHSEISGRNTIWEQGVSYPGLLRNLDAAWSEEGDPAGVNDEGILINRIRSFKNAAIFGKTLIVGTAGEGGSELQIAESMTFSRQCAGDVGGNLRKIPEVHLRYIHFFHDQFEYYRDVQNVADVAVLYSYASMGFNNDLPAVSFFLFTQALIQSKVLFDIVFDEHLKDLSKYRALVLADQECLDDAQMNLIRQYVEGGGGLVATAETSLYTPWRLRRPDFGLEDLFGVHATELGAGAEPVQRAQGQGRVSYIPAIQPAIEKPPGAQMTSRYWKLPLNLETLIEQVRWAVGRKLTLEVYAPETVALVAELMEQQAESRRMVHLLNYAAPQGVKLSDIQVDVELPQGKSVRQVKLLSPDGGEPTIPRSQVQNGRIRFAVPWLETYTLAILELQ